MPIAPPRAPTVIAIPSAPPARSPIPIETSPIDPEAVTSFERNSSLAPVAFKTAEPPRLTAIAVSNTARSEARGLTPDSDVRHATLAEGQRASQPVDLSPGDCVTVIAHGGLGVMEVDAFLMAPTDPGAPSETALRAAVLAQDARNGPIAVIGGQGGCFLFSGRETIHAELVVQARRGAGPVVVQVFRARPAPVVKPVSSPPR